MSASMTAPRSDETAVRSYERSLERSRLSLTRPDRPRSFSMCGREWDLFPEVFAPPFSPSTAVSLNFLGLDSDATDATAAGATDGGSFLEVGCGAGVIAVQAALAGHERVVALDVSLRAVENTAANAERHGVTERLRALPSDLFSALDESEQFDTIFWSSNYVLGPEEYEYESIHERAYVDAGYRTHRRYIDQALRWTTENGSVLLHFCSRGDRPVLHRIAEEYGRAVRTLKSLQVREGEYGDDMVEHMLLEIVPLGH